MMFYRLGSRNQFSWISFMILANDVMSSLWAIKVCSRVVVRRGISLAWPVAAWKTQKVLFVSVLWMLLNPFFPLFFGQSLRYHESRRDTIPWWHPWIIGSHDAHHGWPVHHLGLHQHVLEPYCLGEPSKVAGLCEFRWIIINVHLNWSKSARVVRGWNNLLVFMVNLIKCIFGRLVTVSCESDSSWGMNGSCYLPQRA